MRQIVRFSLATFLLFSVSGLAACTEDGPVHGDTGSSLVGNGSDDSSVDSGDNDENNMESDIKITVNGASFNATLADNATAQAFAAMLPVTLEMDELNGNRSIITLTRACLRLRVPSMSFTLATSCFTARLAWCSFTKPLPPATATRA